MHGLVRSISNGLGLHHKAWYGYLKGGVLLGLAHGIVAVHAAHARAQVAPRHILVPLAGLQHGLFAYYALAFYLAAYPRTFPDVPVPAHQLHLLFAVVFNGYSIGKHVLPLHRPGVVRVVEGLYNDGDAVGG